MATESPLRLILASASPARRELLERAGYQFEVHPAHIDEPMDVDYANPRQVVEHIAWLKAEAVARETTEGLLLAADTIAWLDGAPIGKPADEADARRILTSLGGREHELWTGVCLWRRPDDLQIQWQERTLVHFTPLSWSELERYLATRQWENNSGAYAILEEDDPYVRVVEGSLSNVIGLPMESLERVLRWLGVSAAGTVAK
jgi:septum formation protein